jgi:hypothetical protein
MVTRKSEPLQVPREAADSTAHLDLSKAVRVSLPNLKLSTETISRRMPSTLLETIKIEANKRGRAVSIVHQDDPLRAISETTRGFLKPVGLGKYKPQSHMSAVIAEDSPLS